MLALAFECVGFEPSEIAQQVAVETVLVFQNHQPLKLHLGPNVIECGWSEKMFNQKSYVNGFIKDHYKTYKIRVKKEDRFLTTMLSRVPNFNQYVLSLIAEDIQRRREYPFINNDVTIDFELSKTMKDLVDEAEKADALGDYGLYMNLADAIDSQGKKEASKHIISESQWRKLTRRYHL